MAQPAPHQPRPRADAWAQLGADPQLAAALDRLCGALVRCGLDVWQQRQAAEQATARAEDGVRRRA